MPFSTGGRTAIYTAPLSIRHPSPLHSEVETHKLVGHQYSKEKTTNTMLPHVKKHWEVCRHLHGFVVFFPQSYTYFSISNDTTCLENGVPIVRIELAGRVDKLIHQLKKAAEGSYPVAFDAHSILGFCETYSAHDENDRVIMTYLEIISSRKGVNAA